VAIRWSTALVEPPEAETYLIPFSKFRTPDLWRITN